MDLIKQVEDCMIVLKKKMEDMSKHIEDIEYQNKEDALGTIGYILDEEMWRLCRELELLKDEIKSKGVHKICKGLCKQCNNKDYCNGDCHIECYEECWSTSEEDAKGNYSAPTFCYDDCQCFLSSSNNI